MAGLFVSYRRDDRLGFAGRLADDLTDVFGADMVFRDIEIPVAQDFSAVLQRAVAASDALVVVIGKAWAGQSSGRFSSRLFEPNDWVRTEIESAFELHKLVIPVLVAGAKMPAAKDLPDSINSLSRLQAFEMTDRHWDNEMRDLVKLIRAAIPSLALAPPARPAPSEESLAQVLRDLGRQVLHEVSRHRSDDLSTSRPRESGGSRQYQRNPVSRALLAILKLLRKASLGTPKCCDSWISSKRG